MTEAGAGQAGPRFFFVHLQKTAGTSLFMLLRKHFGPSAVYPDSSDGEAPNSVLLVEHLLERWHVRRDEIRLVTGHFPLCTTEVLGAPFRTFTVLRDPVERTLSQLRHRHALDAASRAMTLEDMYGDQLFFFSLVHNHMVKMLALTPSEMTAGAATMVEFRPEHLDRAKANLRGMDVFGLQDRFEEFLDELTDRFGWSLGPAPRANRTDPVEVSDAFRARIIRDNALDVELYTYACDLYETRRHR